MISITADNCDHEVVFLTRNFACLSSYCVFDAIFIDFCRSQCMKMAVRINLLYKSSVCEVRLGHSIVNKIT